MMVPVFCALTLCSMVVFCLRRICSCVPSSRHLFINLKEPFFEDVCSHPGLLITALSHTSITTALAIQTLSYRTFHEKSDESRNLQKGIIKKKKIGGVGFCAGQRSEIENDAVKLPKWTIPFRASREHILGNLNTSAIPIPRLGFMVVIYCFLYMFNLSKLDCAVYLFECCEILVRCMHGCRLRSFQLWIGASNDSVVYTIISLNRVQISFVIIGRSDA